MTRRPAHASFVHAPALGRKEGPDNCLVDVSFLFLVLVSVVLALCGTHHQWREGEVIIGMDRVQARLSPHGKMNCFLVQTHQSSKL